MTFSLIEGHERDSSTVVNNVCTPACELARKIKPNVPNPVKKNNAEVGVTFMEDRKK